MLFQNEIYFKSIWFQNSHSFHVGDSCQVKVQQSKVNITSCVWRLKQEERVEAHGQCTFWCLNVLQSDANSDHTDLTETGTFQAHALHVSISPTESRTTLVLEDGLWAGAEVV